MVFDRNKEIRQRAKESGIYLWEIAEELGISAQTFSNLLRHELSERDKREIFQIIAKLSGRED